MSFEWYETTLGEICKFTAGSAFNPEHQGGTFGQYPFIKVSDMNLSGNEIFIRHANNFVSSELKDGMKAKEHPEGATVFAKIGVALQSNRRRLLVKPTIIDNNMMSATPKTGKVSSRFLYFLLSTLDFNTISAGSALPYLNVSDLQKMSVKIPRDAKVQQAIENVLGAIDDRITLLRETNTTLAAIAQALFKSWFVDFDPVHAKMQGRTPEGMIEATAALFPDSFEESELGPVPKGWRVGLLGDIAKTVKKQLSPTDLHAGLNYVGLEHIPRKSLSLVDWDDASGLESAKAAFSKGDVLFGKLRPYFHKVVIAPFDGVCSTDILVCQPTKQSYRGITAQHLFSDELISYADRLSNGAKMPRVNWGDLAAYQVVLPTEVVSDAFSNAIDPLIERIIHNVHEAKTLASLRDTLLPRLISGQLRVHEIAEVAES